MCRVVKKPLTAWKPALQVLLNIFTDSLAAIGSFATSRKELGHEALVPIRHLFFSHRSLHAPMFRAGEPC